MADDIHVAVVAPSGDHKSYRLRYVDPGPPRKQYWRNTKTTDERKARDLAAAWKLELKTGHVPAKAITGWDEFRTRYTEEYLASLAEKSRKAYATTMNHIERLMHPRKVSDLTTQALSRFAAQLRAEKKSEASIKSYLGTVQALLSWAKKMRLIAVVPELPAIKRAESGKEMKGRPISEAEFAKYLAAVESVVGAESASSWKHWLEGLWWSGLRLRESLILSWDNKSSLRLDYSGSRPMLAIPARLEKGKRNRLLPLAWEFCDFLARTPKEERSGLVFRLGPVACPVAKGGRTRNVDGQIDPDWVDRIACRVGKMSGVVVDDNGDGRLKYASPHDLRRAFGTRWALRVKPPVLMQMMRHSDIKTTMKYYVSLDHDDIAEAIWATRPTGCKGVDCSVSPKNGTQTTGTQENQKAAKRSGKKS